MNTSSSTPPTMPLPRWQDLALLDEEALGRTDIAVLDLAAAQGFPDSPTPRQTEECFRRLDHYAWTVADYTKKRLLDFDRYRDHFGGSEGKFRLLMMTQVLHRVHGVRYNPLKIPADSVHTVADSFLHGPLVGEGGTCASVPLVYAAVGRRLGYPIRLATSPMHLFARWAGGDDRFNFDVAEGELCHPPDDFYRTEPQPFGPDEERYCGYLETLTPGREFATVLGQRAVECDRLGRRRDCLEAFAYACRLDKTPVVFNRFLKALASWGVHLCRCASQSLPPISINFPPRRYPWLPQWTERQFIGLQCLEDVLDEPRNRSWLNSSPTANRPISIRVSMS